MYKDTMKKYITNEKVIESIETLIVTGSNYSYYRTDQERSENKRKTQTINRLLLGKESPLSLDQKIDLIKSDSIPNLLITDLTILGGGQQVIDDLMLNHPNCINLPACVCSSQDENTFSLKLFNTMPKLVMEIVGCFSVGTGNRLACVQWLANGNQELIKSWLYTLRDKYVCISQTQEISDDGYLNPLSMLVNYFDDDELDYIYQHYIDLDKFLQPVSNFQGYKVPEYDKMYLSPEKQKAKYGSERIPSPYHSAFKALQLKRISLKTFFEKMRYSNASEFKSYLEKSKNNQLMYDFIQLCYCCTSGKVFAYLKKWKYAPYIKLYNCDFYQVWNKVAPLFKEIEGVDIDYNN